LEVVLRGLHDSEIREHGGDSEHTEMKFARMRNSLRSQHSHRFEDDVQLSVRRRLPLPIPPRVPTAPGQAVQAPHRSPKPDAGPLTLTTHILPSTSLRARWSPGRMIAALDRRAAAESFNRFELLRRLIEAGLKRRPSQPSRKTHEVPFDFRAQA
jgi:hypothetical protein